MQLNNNNPNGIHHNSSKIPINILMTPTTTGSKIHDISRIISIISIAFNIIYSSLILAHEYSNKIHLPLTPNNVKSLWNRIITLSCPYNSGI